MEGYATLIAYICESIKENAEEIQLRKLAHKFGFTQAHFSRIFKDVAGMTWREYLMELKIERSKELLLDPSKLIKEVAYELGYADPSNFTEMFRKKLGITPSQYRANAGI